MTSTSTTRVEGVGGGCCGHCRPTIKPPHRHSGRGLRVRIVQVPEAIVRRDKKPSLEGTTSTRQTTLAERPASPESCTTPRRQVLKHTPQRGATRINGLLQQGVGCFGPVGLRCAKLTCLIPFVNCNLKSDSASAADTRVDP